MTPPMLRFAVLSPGRRLARQAAQWSPETSASATTRSERRFFAALSRRNALLFGRLYVKDFTAHGFAVIEGVVQLFPCRNLSHSHFNRDLEALNLLIAVSKDCVPRCLSFGATNSSL